MLNPRQLQDIASRKERFTAEGTCHLLPRIKASPYIRLLHDIVWETTAFNRSEMQYLVLEAVDKSLWETRTAKLQTKLYIFKFAAESILRGLIAINSCDGNEKFYVHASKKHPYDYCALF